MMDWAKRPMFRNAANMMGGGHVPLPRMVTGTGPEGVKPSGIWEGGRGAPPIEPLPELFSPAEFMGTPLNEMAQAPGFFPQGDLGGGAPSPENTGILSGFTDEEEMAGEEFVDEGIINEARIQAMELFDQGFKELMAIFQAETAAGGVAAEEIEMTLDEELEVIEGQAEAQVKEMMDLPEEVDLIPAEVVENYRQMAQTMLFSPEMGAEPAMEEIPRMIAGGGTFSGDPADVWEKHKALFEEEEKETDPLAVLEAQRKASTARLDERKRIAAEDAAAREEALQGRIRKGDFNVLSEEERKVNWEKLDKMVDRIRDVAKREAEEKSYYSPAGSTMGGAWLDALVRSPRMGKLAGDKAALDFEIEIEKLKQVERQAINSGNAGMLKDVYIQGQKIQDALTNTLLGKVGDIEGRAITEAGKILTQEIKDTSGINLAGQTALFWRDELKKWPPGSPEYLIAEQGLKLEGVPSAPELANQQLKDMAQVFEGLEAQYGSLEPAERKAQYLQLYPWAVDEKGEVLVPDINLYPLLLKRAEAMLQRLYSSQGGDEIVDEIVDARNLPRETIEQNIANGIYREGQILILGVDSAGNAVTHVVPKTSP